MGKVAFNLVKATVEHIDRLVHFAAQKSKFLLHAVHGDDGICAGLCLQGRHQRPEQPVDERRYYFMRTFLL